MGFLPYALEAGMTARDFWESDIGEITSTINAYTQRMKRRLAENYNHASMIATFTRQAFAGRDFPSLETLYPKLFGEQQTEKPKENPNNWIRFKEEFTDYSNKFNKLRRQNDLRGTEHKNNS